LVYLSRSGPKISFWIAYGFRYPSFAESGDLILEETAMARVSIYLNFPRSTEDAFNFYKSVFGTQFAAPIVRFKDIPSGPGQPPLNEADKNLIMHVELPILGGQILMGTDAPESMGFKVTPGNNIFINVEPDTRAETDRLFRALSAGGEIQMALQEMFWGGYFGSIVDRFGVRWMFNCASKT
jgi:PhnB protein